MSERSFRLIQGVYILLALYFELDVLILAYLVVIAIEGLTNWRIPIVVNRLRYGKLAVAAEGTALSAAGPLNAKAITHKEQTYKFDFEAERVLRLAVFILLIFTVLIFPESGWFFPWFIGAMLFMAGVTNICPMMLLFRYLGFR
ncbi:YgaP family membrane protein [Kaarinaea lacus]